MLLLPLRLTFLTVIMLINPPPAHLYSLLCQIPCCDHLANSCTACSWGPLGLHPVWALGILLRVFRNAHWACPGPTPQVGLMCRKANESSILENAKLLSTLAVLPHDVRADKSREMPLRLNQPSVSASFTSPDTEGQLHRNGEDSMGTHAQLQGQALSPT